MKRQFKRFVYLVLSLMILVTSIPGFPRLASAANPTPVKLSSLASGNTVQFGGQTWIVVDPSTGYLLLQGFYGGYKAFDSDDTQIFNPSDPNNIAYYLNNDFYNSLPSADRALVQSSSWTLEDNWGGSHGSVDCMVGLISYSEFETSKGSVLINDYNTWWLRSPLASNNTYVCTATYNTGGARFVNQTAYVRPALHLNSNILVSGGNGGTVLEKTPTPTITTPVLPGAASVSGTAVMDASVVLSVNGTAQPTVVADASGNWTVAGLTLNAGDTISVTAIAIGNNESNSATATVPNLPGAPTIGTATAGNGQAEISFTPPTNDGGSAITGYTVTSSPGGFTGTGSSSPITVSGLSNGTAYNFTVTATNAAGTGVASSATNSITPAASITDLTNTATTSSTATFTWTAASGATSIIIQQFVNGGSSWTTATTTAAIAVDATTATVTGLSPATGYDFKLFVTGGVNAGNSNTVIVTTDAAPVVPPKTYSVTIGSLSGGSITANPTSAASGSAINLIITPNPGMQLTPGTLKYNDGTADYTISGSSFTMPAANVTVSAKFELIPNNTNGGGGGGSSGGGSASSGGTTVTGSVLDGTTGAVISNLKATATADRKGNYTVSIQPAQTVTFQQPSGTMSPLSDLTKVSYAAAGGSSAAVSADGTINLANLAKGTDNQYKITYDLGNGQTLTLGTLEVIVSSNGAVSLKCTLIDPYGLITDAATGKPIAGAKVTLYYANTERNKTNGKTPDTIPALPGIDGFKPNNNQNSQTSDGNGAYGFMVFPNTDYYIAACKDGYEQYTSPTISVGKDIVHWDFKMSAPITGFNRQAGQNQVDTALAIAKANYTGNLSNVVLATADNYPDALAGSVLAYKLNAPILLVGSSEADQGKVLDYLKSNLAPSGNVYILGGTAVVSADMEAKVKADGFGQITRLGGTDRYETSVKIADQLKVESGKPIVLAYGENYPDALSISSIAAESQYPILLAQKDGISDVVKNEIAAIKPGKVYIIGGEGVISSAVESQIEQITSLDKTTIIRIAGLDRYVTSLAVAKYFNLAGQSVCIATGRNFPDALAGSVYAANHNTSIILADGRLPDQVVNYLQGKELTGATIFGGEAVVSKVIEQQLGQLIANRK